MRASLVFVLFVFLPCIVADWNFYGRDLSNSHFDNDNIITSQNVHTLKSLWNFTSSAVNQIPTVADGIVYFTSYDGKLYALNADTGAVLWSRVLGTYTGNPNSYSRTSPALSGTILVVGDQLSATILAFDRFFGIFLWKTLLDSFPYAFITSAPSIYNGNVLVGVSSQEETIAQSVPNYPCCSFRGSFLSVNLFTGHINWKLYTVPEGFNGGAVWGSSPAVDPLRNAVYIGTGNNYFLSESVEECLENHGTNCFPVDNYSESLLSLDIDTGAVNWVHSFNFEAGFIDVWTYACVYPQVNPQNCPPNPGQDWDFGQMPMLFTVQQANRFVDAVGAGQKSGLFITLNRDDGSLIWSSMVGPGGYTGGILFSSAVDGQRIYTSIANAGDPKNYTVNGHVINYGSFAALDINTGRLLWQVADPLQSYDFGGVSVVNDVVFGPSLLGGTLFAFDARTGAQLWSYAPPQSPFLAAAPSGDNGRVYLGGGFQLDDTLGGVFAFELPRC